MAKSPKRAGRPRKYSSDAERRLAYRRREAARVEIDRAKAEDGALLAQVILNSNLGFESEYVQAALRIMAAEGHTVQFYKFDSEGNAGAVVFAKEDPDLLLFEVGSIDGEIGERWDGPLPPHPYDDADLRKKLNAKREVERRLMSEGESMALRRIGDDAVKERWSAIVDRWRASGRGVVRLEDRIKVR